MHWTRRNLLSLALVPAMPAASASRAALGAPVLDAPAPDAPPEPAGYRMDRYQGPTPRTLRGATVLSTQEAEALWKAHAAAFVDVLPQAPRPAGLAAGTIWRDKPRRDIPGSVWLPDTGYGVLAPSVLAYFTRGLTAASRGDKGATLVFYCKAECWMSWNAAKRALSLGYRHVDWYPGGTTEWEKAGLPLELREPQPRAAAAG